MIGSEVLNYVDNNKNLEIALCETMKDNNDMILQMKILCKT